MTDNSNRRNNSNNLEDNELVYGVHSVIELLKSATADQRVNKVLVQKGLSSEHIAEAIKLAKRDRLIVQEVPRTN
jgi:rRNA methylases